MILQKQVNNRELYDVFEEKEQTDINGNVFTIKVKVGSYAKSMLIAQISAAQDRINKLQPILDSINSMENP